MTMILFNRVLYRARRRSAVLHQCRLLYREVSRLCSCDENCERATFLVDRTKKGKTYPVLNAGFVKMFQNCCTANLHQSKILVVIPSNCVKIHLC